jgi:pimeloyl-ACP methyl ester carboxylesterase
LSEGVSAELANVLVMVMFSSAFATTPAADQWRKKFVEEDPARMHAMSRAVFDRPDVTHLLREVRVPAIVIHGEDDIAIPMERGEELSKALSAPMHRIPAAGHASVHERPEIVAPVIREFVESLA